MIKAKINYLYNGRYLFVMVVFTLLFSVLAWRLVDLMIFQNRFLLQQGNARSLRVFNVPAYRGMITDRNGEPLAVSTPVSAVWVNPKELDFDNKALIKVAMMLSIKPVELVALLERNKNREFVYLKRGVRPDVAKSVLDLDIKGIYALREFRRYYPEGEATAHVIGFTNIDDVGQEGLELAFEKWLSGKAGKKRVMRDRLGHIIANIELLSIPKPGHDIALSIDRRVQYAVYRELKKAIEAYDAASGSVVIMDVHTGEILAMTNFPSFNPNFRYKSRTKDYRNRAVTDIFEPGSVIKPFSVASALSSGRYRPHSIIDTYPSRLRFGRNTISDEKPYGKISVSEVLMHSSNVGVAKLVLGSDPSYYLELLKRSGFGQITPTGFPGESAGLFLPQQMRHPFVLGTVAFGYGISVTALQLAQAFTIFGNDGYLVPATLIKRTESVPKKRVITPVVAQQMLRMLEQVVNKGTGKSARVQGYRIAGKTGTARIASPDGYYKDRHFATFAGVVPASHPKLVVVVTVNEPKKDGRYYASQTAAPLFKDIVTEVLRILNITPDNIA